MKKIFKPLLFISFLFLVFSCEKKEEIKKIEVSIEGMTCEIGCAKLIESKVSKLEGVTISDVSFEKKIGVFTFDVSKISSEEIIKNINGIAGGELYKVTETKMVN